MCASLASKRLIKIADRVLAKRCSSAGYSQMAMNPGQRRSRMRGRQSSIASMPQRWRPCHANSSASFVVLILSSGFSALCESALLRSGTCVVISPSSDVNSSGRRTNEARAAIEPITSSMASKLSSLVSGQKNHTVTKVIVLIPIMSQYRRKPSALLNTGQSWLTIMTAQTAHDKHKSLVAGRYGPNCTTRMFSPCSLQSVCVLSGNLQNTNSVFTGMSLATSICHVLPTKSCAGLADQAERSVRLSFIHAADCVTAHVLACKK